MPGRINIEVKLFGAFRELQEKSYRFDLPCGVHVDEVREALKSAIAKKSPQFAQKNLLDVSALATETAILRNDDVLTQDTQLAILPPISGG